MLARVRGREARESGMAGVLLVVLPGLAIAGWLAFLFIRKRHYEKGVIVFLSITLAPLLAWYLTRWLRDDSPLYEALEALPYGLWELLPALALIGTFAWLCIYWARRAQALEPKAATLPPLAANNSPPPEAQPTSAPEQPSEPGARERLETLEQLRRDGLLTEQEYAEKRAEIISKL